MRFIGAIAGIVIGASIAVTLLVRVVLALLRRRPSRFWRRALLAHAVLVPIYVFLLTPAIVGGLASTRIGTRGDERAYAGPRIAADGTWVRQGRETLANEAAGKAAVDPQLREAERKAAVHFETKDGVRIRAFLVPPRTTPPRCTVVLIHGLFRGALETETPAAMFRDLGAEVLMVEMRNHGGSGRATPSFGLRESRDVLAAVAWLRRAPERATRPLILFAVSLGTAAVMRAAPDIANLGGLILDAPMDDLLLTAHRMLSEGPHDGHRGLSIFQPFRTLTILSLEAWNGFRFTDVRPMDDLTRLDPAVPVLLIGGGNDARMPPSVVTAMFERVPARPPKKAVWIREGSGHGDAWSDDPTAYRAKLAAFLELAAP